MRNEPVEFTFFGFQKKYLDTFLDQWFLFDEKNYVREHRYDSKIKPFGYEYASRFQRKFWNYSEFIAYCKSQAEVNLGIFGKLRLEGTNIGQGMSCEIFTSGPMPRLEFCFNEFAIREAEDEELEMMYDYVKRMAETFEIPYVVFCEVSTSPEEFRFDGKSLEIDLILLNQSMDDDEFIDRIWVHKGWPAPDNYPVIYVQTYPGSYQEYQSIRFDGKTQDLYDQRREERAREKDPLTGQAIAQEIHSEEKKQTFSWDGSYHTVPYEPASNYPLSVPQKNKMKFDLLALIDNLINNRISYAIFSDEFSDLLYKVPHFCMFKTDLSFFEEIDRLTYLSLNENEIKMEIEKRYKQYSKSNRD
ncbi:hypothetical protein COW36_22825 [bacterium (Candidatus Blackallbacteria) CG17_big_fil_post_rev_8_21_14_2_50_48_46]|uniref:Uncharacterized protein n=1 Tax=bacterium (Candidatus Blackallbacteria) CG17_big_fil_post_rev_8_21_14_2_50_48_46 TaxID=2014261 RepID=A0A2M7FY79_9BACT|nr:MAG: hypothetical protein COW64_15895 [bacterium (Candidatus Blackallbacteria) CG18_big_fil_WC_8_21_14_2_50_49_26]PIW14085.1 MAG: hypothetical protein COW36_22825 [bacterium (Candidatus Blackallbacteria) CG17_big_fil_post_rev_8_21_14_2_50_48_46]PIW45815.1 MAG: hypothetical protein COW20_18490 [bacterium (Candidatus Blackallbacteria) CG13_big_fil_rev_8_21_14_2_50_49_14]